MVRKEKKYCVCVCARVLGNWHLCQGFSEV